jgi:UDP-2-acetamido-3-amino-2,3-dideoxy-glucuronate N-acetyltransferase
MSASEPRVGVVGAGGWGKNLVRVCADLGVLTAVCDPAPASLQAIATAYPGVAVVSALDDLLDQVDAVVIGAPAELHAQLALCALDAGKHVFVEKPFTLSVADGEMVAAAAAAAKLQVFVGHLLIYHPAVRALRRLVAAGEIGRLWHVRSRRVSLGKLRNRESVWWSFAPHDISLMLALLGEEPLGVVAAQAGWLTPRMPDAAYADYSFSNGRSAHIEVSWLDPNKMWQLDVFGTDGVATLAEAPGQTRLKLARCGARLDENGALCAWRGASTDIAFEQGEPLREEMVAFLTAVRFNIAAETDAAEGLAVIRAVAGAARAANSAVLEAAI